MKTTITKIARFTTDTSNKPLVTRDNRPYTRVRIQIVDQPDWISGFENETTSNWKEGDMVEIEVTKNGQWFNFTTPKKSDLFEARVAILEEGFKELKNKLDRYIAEH